MTRLKWIVLGMAAALVALAILTIWHLRRDAIDSQARELSLLSLALTDDLNRGLQGAEEGLQAMRTELREGRLPASAPETQRALHTRAELMPLIDTLWLVDSDGRLLSASAATPMPELSSFSPALGGLPEDAIAFSRTFTDELEHRDLVALAFRFDSPGTAHGWILAGISVDAFLGAFSVAAPAADARMGVFRDDGARLAGSIVDRPTVDESRLAQRLAAASSMQLRRFRDGSERLVGLHSLPRYGLRVVLTRDLDAVLVPWREAAQLTAAGIAIVLAILVGAMVFVQRADRHRAEARRALQSQLARASKLESLGTLAGGVAHDFNNVLAVIIGFGEMAHDSAPPGSDQARQLDKMLQAALRGRSLVERILAFSRGGGRAATVFELQPIVEEVLALLTNSLRAGIVLERELEAPGARLRGDPTLAFQAVMNLCTNAMQAMAAGGMLSVHLERLHVAAPRVLSHSQLAPGDYLALTVSDQGEGISPEVMERLFEPFFTTRRPQAGTGLGLAVVHGVVAEFRGAIDVQSSPGHGARFALYFPECKDAPGVPVPATAPPPRGAGQTLLVIDDEPALVALAEETLRGLGYAPVGFGDPVAALQALRENPRRFAAVITDEIMPALSGTEFTAELRALAPQLPVLLVSGYGGALLAARAAAAGVTRVLAKPLQRAELAHALAELLHEKSIP